MSMSISRNKSVLTGDLLDHHSNSEHPVFESLYFRCFDHFSLFVCTNLTNNFRYFSIIFLRVLFSKYPGKNMHNFLYLFFIDTGSTGLEW